MSFLSLATLVLKVSAVSLTSLTMKQLFFVLSLAVNLFILCVFSGLAVAEGDVSDQLASASVTQEMIQSRIAETKASSGLDELSKASLLELYQKSLSNMQANLSSEEKARSYQQLAVAAPEEIQRLREEITTQYSDDERV